MTDRFVYLIEAQNGLVKIGVSRNPRSRLTTINLHSPVPARLIAMWLGGGVAEHDLHILFRAQRSHNEWFRIEGALAAYVEAKRGVGVDAIASWDDVTSVGMERRRATLRERISAAGKARWADPVWRERTMRNRALQVAARRASRDRYEAAVRASTLGQGEGVSA